MDLENRHAKKVKKLQEKLKKSVKKVALSSTCSNTLREGIYKNHLDKIDLSSFTDIIKIDAENGFAYIEPRITFSDLCKATLKKGWIPQVVPEFKSITVGGAIMGGALESSSFRFGQFNDTCSEYELVLGNGEKVKASPEKNNDLFYGISGSYGTIALLTLVKLKLLRAKPFVTLDIFPFSTLEHLLDFFSKNGSCDFLEGIAFAQNRFLAIRGTLSDHCTQKTFRQKKYYDPWYISHLSEIHSPKTESMSLEEYLFRFDRGAFWMGCFLSSFKNLLRGIFKINVKQITNRLKKPHTFQIPFLLRFCFGGLFSSTNLYKIWHRVDEKIKENLFFIQDFYTPLEKVESFITFIKENLNIFPLWICPIKATTHPQFCAPHYNPASSLINIGVYGIPQKSIPISQLTSLCEKKIVSCSGKKMLYSLTYYDKKTFNEVYNQEKFESLRKKFHAEKRFPSLYNKVAKSL
jgi:Delta24-sterol reductase